MIDIKLLRENFEETCKKIRSRNKPYSQLDDFSNLDKEYREKLTKIQSLNAKRNDLSKQIGLLVKDPSQKDKMGELFGKKDESKTKTSDEKTNTEANDNSKVKN